MSTVGSVVLEKVYAAIARENYVAITQEIAPKKLEDVVVGLESHFAKLGVDMAQCDVCGGWSPERLPNGATIDACPFCNDGKGDEPKAAPPPPAPSSAIVQVTSAKPAKRTKVEQAPAPSAPSLSVLAGGRTLASEKELDDAIARFNRAAEAGADSTYLMGVELKKMRDYLWQQRTEGGKPKYKSYNQFVAEELGISIGLANRVRRIAESFTIEEFRKHGAAALKALIAAPKEEHEALLKRHEEGATAAQLEAEVKQIREGKGIAVIETDATREAAASGKNVPTAAATAAAAKARKKPEAAITVAFKDAEPKLKFLCRPTKKGEEPRAARSIEDKPYAVVEALNGVKVYVALKLTPAGEIVGKLTAKRDEDEGGEE